MCRFELYFIYYDFMVPYVKVKFKQKRTIRFILIVFIVAFVILY